MLRGLQQIKVTTYFHVLFPIVIFMRKVNVSLDTPACYGEPILLPERYPSWLFQLEGAAAGILGHAQLTKPLTQKAGTQIYWKKQD